MSLPQIIQGGMGVAVSSWRLSRAVALAGELGVVSGTALDAVFARRLQLGDPDGKMRVAVENFPFRDIAERVWNRYYVPNGKLNRQAFKSRPLAAQFFRRDLLDLTVVANFAEVFLAKQGHDGQVGINLLEKIQLCTLPSLFGAMLANVDYVLMGAGIPREIPVVLDRFAAWEDAEIKLDVAGKQAGEDFPTRFSPGDFSSSLPCELRRPKFLPIVSSATLAVSLATRGSGMVDGFVVEGPTAGGHNAPPRGALRLTEEGEPLYGPRDIADLSEIAKLGLPFWLAGSYASPEKLVEARSLGAAGIQVGTAFAFCDASGITAEIKERVVSRALAHRQRVFTDPYASPTGFPFKVLDLDGSLSEPKIYEERERVCDLGYLRQCYRREDGSLGYRCSAEPVDDFLAKGGKLGDERGRKCVCNGLFATVGLGQLRKDGFQEPPLTTAGDDALNLSRFVPDGKTSYSASDVIAYLR